MPIEDLYNQLPSGLLNEVGRYSLYIGLNLWPVGLPQVSLAFGVTNVIWAYQ